MIALLLVIMIVGGLFLYKEIKKKNEQVSPLVLESPMTPAQVGLLTGMSGGEFDKNSVTRQLQSVGFTDAKIQDFYEWLDNGGGRSTSDVYYYLQSQV